jgi:hypothetical protein
MRFTNPAAKDPTALIPDASCCALKAIELFRNDGASAAALF